MSAVIFGAIVVSVPVKFGFTYAGFLDASLLNVTGVSGTDTDDAPPKLKL
jgi:hypothetical protein